jgi:hypothetical protein
MDGDFEITNIPSGKPQEESYAGKALRGIARGTARAVETVVGLPGDIEQSALYLANKARAALGKEPLKQTESLFPTSERVKQSLTKPIEEAVFQKEYLEPRGSLEEFGDTALSDLVSYLIPIAGAGKLTANAIKKAGIITGAGNLTALAAQTFGAGEGTKAGVKMGTMLVASMGGQKQLLQHMNKLYQAAEESIPKNAVISTEKLQPELKKLASILDKGELTPSKEFLRDRLISIEDKISKGTKTIPLAETWELKKNINEWLADPKLAPQSERYAMQLSHHLNDTLQGAATKHPEFIKNLREADDIYRGLHQQTKVARFLQKHVNADKILSPITGIAFYLNPMGALKGGLASYGAKSVWLPAEAFARSPEIRKFYIKALGAAAKGNATVASKYVKKFDETAADLYPEQSGEWEVSSLGQQ